MPQELGAWLPAFAIVRSVLTRPLWHPGTAPQPSYPAAVQSIGWVVFGTAMLLVVLHRGAAKAYLSALEARDGHRDPGLSWLTHRDPDPEIERLRRRRLLLVIPAAACVLAGVIILGFAPR
jgi:hypothetical protein